MFYGSENKKECSQKVKKNLHKIGRDDVIKLTSLCFVSARSVPIFFFFRNKIVKEEKKSPILVAIP